MKTFIEYAAGVIVVTLLLGIMLLTLYGFAWVIRLWELFL